MSACQAEAALADALAQAHEQRATAGAQLAQAQRKAAAALAAAAEASARAGRLVAENAALADLVAAPYPEPYPIPITLDPDLPAPAQPPAAPAACNAQGNRISLAVWAGPSSTTGDPPCTAGEQGAAAAPPDSLPLKQRQPSERLRARSAAQNPTAGPGCGQACATPPPPPKRLLKQQQPSEQLRACTAASDPSTDPSGVHQNVEPTMALQPSLKQQQPSEQLRARQAAAAAAAAAAADTAAPDVCPRAPPSSPYASPARQRPPRLAGDSAQQPEALNPDTVPSLKPINAPPQRGAGAGELAPATPVRQKMAKAPGGVLCKGPEGYRPTVEGSSAAQAGKAPSKVLSAPARGAVRDEAKVLLERLQARA